LYISLYKYYTACIYWYIPEQEHILENTNEYPRLKLPEPLSVEDKDRLNELKTNEREFALLLLYKGFTVYPEPQIEGCLATPDFFVINPRTKKGKLLEITLMSENKRMGRKKETFLRKQRQKEELIQTHIPCVFLYRENQELIREYAWGDLF